MAVDDDTVWWRCAYYAYLDSDVASDHADENEARERGVQALRATVEAFLEGKLNFGTLKYRMDNASVESGMVFPSRAVGSTLSDLALGVPVDDLEPALRSVVQLPDDPGEAKGSLMDFDDIMEREVSRGRLKRPQARTERWVELLACLWYIQDRSSWPLVDPGALRYLRDRGEVDPTDPIQGYAEYAAFIRRLAELTGAEMASLEHLLAWLERREEEVPEAGKCFEDLMTRARSMDEQGHIDQALTMYERALSIQPHTPEALLRKAALYEGKGLIMAALGELEALVELEPKDIPAHKKLIALYRSKGMVREHNLEVRRFKAVMGR